MPHRSRPAAAAVFACVAALCGAQSPTNNECFAAISVYDGVNPGAPFGFSGLTFSNIGATNSPLFSDACAYAGHFDNDVFFSYVATCGGTTVASLCTPPGLVPGSLADSVLAVYSSTYCPGGGAPLACNDEFCGGLSEVAWATTVGQTYLIRVGSWNAAQSGIFYLSVRPQGPGNDECAGATTLSVGPNAGDMSCATPSPGVACTGFASPVADVWHKFTPVSNCVLEITLTGAGADRIGLYAGACGGAQTPVECDASGPLDVQTTATAGTTYFVRVGRSGAPGADGSYALVVDCAPLATNDECGGAIPLADGVNPGAPVGTPGLTYSNVGATTSAGFAAAASCAGAGHPGVKDVFFSYVSSVDGPVRVSLCPPPGFPSPTLGDSILEIYPATTCPGGGTALACSDQSCGALSEVVFPAVYGATYYVRVSSWSASGASEGSFNVTVDAAPNDACATATPLSPGVHHGTTGSADPTVPEPGAGCFAFGPNVVDVWYSFTAATACDLVVSLSGPGANALAIYAGTCGAPTLLDCDDFAPTVAVGPNLPAGGTYYVRVGRTNPALAGPFTLTVSCSAPVNDDCAHAIPVFAGVNPAPPDGSGTQTFDNFGATTSGLFPAPTACVDGALHAGASDVFFTYVANCGGDTLVSLCPPPGLPTPDFDSVLTVYDASACPLGTAPPLACGDDSACGGESEVVFAATAGATYLIRVASWESNASYEFAFRLRIVPPFCLRMDAPAGPGSLRIRHVDGPPSAVALTILTVLPGSFPNGPFFGISPTVTEIVLQASSGAPPFVVLLDAAGGSTFGPLLNAPPITLYGVSLALDAFGQIVDATAPAAFAVP